MSNLNEKMVKSGQEPKNGVTIGWIMETFDVEKTEAIVLLMGKI